MKKLAVVLSCEHAVNTIPQAFSALFAPYQTLLNSHRGIDFGAADIALELQKTLGCELVLATVSRLLIDCNRSVSRSRCFSEITQQLSDFEKQGVIQNYYSPFRQQVSEIIQQHIQEGAQVRHLSIHSFTPELQGVVRNADIGILYDPTRPSEKKLAKQWQEAIKNQAPQYRIRLNYPYRGNSDGFTTALRKQWPDGNYLGIELEANQALTLNDQGLASMKAVFSTTLAQLLS